MKIPAFPVTTMIPFREIINDVYSWSFKPISELCDIRIISQGVTPHDAIKPQVSAFAIARNSENEFFEEIAAFAA